MNSLKIDSLEPRICETAIYKKFFSSFQIWPNRMAMKNFIFVVAFLLQVEKGQFEGYSNKGRCNQNLYLNKQYTKASDFTYLVSKGSKIANFEKT